MTPLVREEQRRYVETKKVKVPTHRFAEMKKIGHCIEFLQSDAANYMIGATLGADGRGHGVSRNKVMCTLDPF
jgi:NAD(P)-dependent dehydrogenase (short-subunit alcohol dehydrogenase family)